MATNDVAKALEAYYADQSKPLVWLPTMLSMTRRRPLWLFWPMPGSVGLDAADYAVQAPSFDPASVDPTMRDRALMQFELALSGKVLMFVQDTIRGRLDPNKISGYHDFKRKDVNLTPVLGLLHASPDVTAYLNSRSPSNQEFIELKAELAKLRGESSSDSAHITISLNGILKPGGSSPEMANIVNAIQHRGSDALKVKNAVTLAAYKGTPDYTPELVSLVEDFQEGKRPDIRRRHRPVFGSRHGRRKQRHEDPEAGHRYGAVALAAGRTRSALRLHQPAGLHGLLSQQ